MMDDSISIDPDVAAFLSMPTVFHIKVEVLSHRTRNISQAQTPYNLSVKIIATSIRLRQQGFQFCHGGCNNPSLLLNVFYDLRRGSFVYLSNGIRVHGLQV